jgi:hypothetical protein
VIESQVLKERTDLACQKAYKDGTIGMLLRVLRQKGTVPVDLEQAIRALDTARLEVLGDAAANSATIDDFRRSTGL